MAARKSKVLLRNAAVLAAWRNIEHGAPVDVQEQCTVNPILAAMVDGFRFFGIKQDCVWLGKTEAAASAFMPVFFEARHTFIGP